jgi:hypothetical protein
MIRPLRGVSCIAGNHSFAVSRVMFGRRNSGLFAAAADEDRNEIAENPAGEHAHEELNRR